MKREREDTEEGKGHNFTASTEQPINETNGQNQKNKRLPRKTATKPGFDARMFEETSFYSNEGLRYVKPYHFTFTTHCKGRWIGRKLIDVFSSEFRMESIDYYKAAVQKGKITVNGNIVEPDRILKQNDLIRTCIHRHEPPVSDNPIEFVKNDDEMVVINKPSSIPVHPCGRYRHNTIVFILGEDYGLTNLHTIHRIDRLTSGILMFAKTVSKAQEMEKYVKGRLVKKDYLCRVAGRFPPETLTCSEPIMVVSHKVGVCQVKAEGKEAKTEFNFVSYNGKSSVVRCVPQTGRMHQIRVHLQFLGYPILNDPIYNKPDVWGESNGKGGTTEPVAEILAALERGRKDSILKSRQHESSNNVASGNGDNIGSNQHNYENESDTISNKIPPKKQKLCFGEGNPSYDSECTECQNPIPDPKPNELCIYLHALSYKGPGWEYKTSTPEWANADWDIE